MTIEKNKALLRSLTEAQNQTISELVDMALSVDSVVDEVEFADLLRFIQGQIQFASLSYFQNNDPAFPKVINTQYMPWNWGNSNPSTLYASAVLSDQYEYRVFGRLGTASENTFGVYAGVGADSAAIKLNAKDMVVASDGRFEVYITKEKQGENWIAPLPGMESFASYQVFGNWNDQEKGEIYIECLNAHRLAKPLGMQETVDAFNGYLQRMKDNFKLWVLDIPALMFDSIEDNGLLGPMQPPSAQQGTFFTSIKWKLAPGEALLIDMNIPPETDCSSICLTNRWSQMLDFDKRQTSLNTSQWIDNGADNVRVLLSTKDLGVKNWLDGTGYSNGIVSWRITQADQPDAPVVTVINEADVDTYFPKEQKVTQAQRKDDLARRQAHCRKIYGI